ncbi:hypothetical protein GQ55_8G208500 [Panicum hallii var. hallii]|uniref:Uncharacterized protein n=1 Tax=Panicum hallii var. hallii TaxID=1504633 RepID=A0A2T7CPL9_9POAL|nr:hypothetical protein GQ55_8G208500 [Panicum hallii var. hallii]
MDEAGGGPAGRGRGRYPIQRSLQFGLFMPILANASTILLRLVLKSTLTFLFETKSIVILTPRFVIVSEHMHAISFITNANNVCPIHEIHIPS